LARLADPLRLRASCRCARELPLRGAAGYQVPAGRLLTRPVQHAVHMADRARVQPASAVAASSD
jgi:hypothetical protein